MSRIPEQMELVTNRVQEVMIATALAKRDLVPIQTNPINVDGMKTKRFTVFSSLDQAVSIQSQITFDNGQSWKNMGAAKSVAANAGGGLYTETDANLVALSMIKGLIRFNVTLTVAPTTGTLDLMLHMGQL